MKKLVICAAVLLAAGCAKRPENIKPTPVAADTYAAMQCPQLAQLKTQKEAELAQLEEHQKQVANDDFSAMVVFHVPAASLGGKDKEEQVARVKGEVQAIDSVYRTNNCVG